MNRRAFVTRLAAVLAAPLAAGAQQGRKIPRVGYVLSGASLSTMLGPVPSNTTTEGFLRGLRDLGYIDGQNIILERRSAEGNYEQLPNVLVELIRLNVDAIVTGGSPATAAAKAATATIPIVALGVFNPVESGLVQTLARPGGNVTGVALLARELRAKHLQLIKETVPAVTRVAVLRNPSEPTQDSLWRETQTVARQLNLTVQSIEVRHPTEFQNGFSLMTRGHAGGLIVLPDPLFFVSVGQLADLATSHRIPAISDFREFAYAGGLLCYGASVPDMGRHAAVFLDRILKGAKPADLPVEQPTKFELVINMKTAKALGLTIPPSLLLRADEVIE